MKEKLSKKEYEELCKLLISDSEDDFLLGKNMAKSMKMRWGIMRVMHLEALSKNRWAFSSGFGLERKFGYKHEKHWINKKHEYK